ncbi:MAG: hypothetical protein ACI4PX_00425 [Ruminococcus sp.]
MDTERIKSLFTLFTGQNDYDTYLPIISISIVQVNNMLLENADKNDPRLDMLTASVANYRYVQMLASRIESISTYNGEMLIPDKNSNAVKYAESIMLDYMNLCSDLIGQNTVFISTED